MIPAAMSRNRDAGRTTCLMLLMAVVIFLGAPAVSAAEKVVIPGTGASQEMLRAVAKEFMAERPDVLVEIPDSTGSGGGIKAAASGEGDMGRVSRKLKEKEALLGLAYLPFARVPIVFVANPSIPPLNLTTAQTRDIFSGKVTNWKDVGGPDAKIRVLSRYEGDSTIHVIRSNLEGWKELQVTQYSLASDTDQENVDAITQHKDAIGYCNLAQALKAGLPVMSLDGVSLEDPGYPLYTEQAFVYKPDKMSGAVKSFADYLLGSKAQAIMRKAGATPINR